VISQKSSIIDDLRAQLLQLQGFKSEDTARLAFGLGPIASAFPNQALPTGCIHEFIGGKSMDNHAPTTAFISGLLSTLMVNNGAAIWISQSRNVFPPALRAYGLQPDHFIFLNIKSEKDALWAMEESLKCGALTAVIAEIKNIDFTQSRRLQLAVEESKVTGFLLRDIQKLNTTASVTRWRITSASSEAIDGLPGIGFPRWKVELLRVRNGKPGAWYVTWRNGRFDDIKQVVDEKLAIKSSSINIAHRQAG
jgi:protein ImuA